MFAKGTVYTSDYNFINRAAYVLIVHYNRDASVDSSGDHLTSQVQT